MTAATDAVSPGIAENKSPLRRKRKKSVADFEYPIAIHPADLKRIPSSAPARVLMALIAHRNAKTGQCNPTIETLSIGTKVPERTVERALQKLKNAGLIDWQVTNDPHAGSRYTLLVTPMVCEQLPTRTAAPSPAKNGGSTPAGSDGTTPARSGAQRIEPRSRIEESIDPSFPKQADCESAELPEAKAILRRRFGIAESVLEQASRDIVVKCASIPDEQLAWADKPSAIITRALQRGKMPEKFARRRERPEFRWPPTFASGPCGICGVGHAQGYKDAPQPCEACQGQLKRDQPQ